MLVNRFARQEEFKDIAGLFPQKKGAFALAVEEDIWPFLISYLASAYDMPLLAITSTIDRSRELLQEICALTGEKIYGWPPLGSSMYYRDRSTDIINVSERLKTLSSLRKGSQVIVSGISSCLNLMDKEALGKLNPVKLAKGEAYSLDNLSKKLVQAGYERVNMVFDKGEFSIKGSIVDIYNIAMDRMVRLDFFGDELESIFMVDPVSRKIMGKQRGVEVYPFIDPWQPGGAGRMSLQEYIKEESGGLCLVLCDPMEVGIKLESDRDILEKILQKDIEKTVFGKPQDLRRELLDQGGLHKGADILIRLNSSAKDQDIELGIKGQKKSFGQPGTFISNIGTDFGSKRKVAVSISEPKRRRMIKKLLADEGISFEQNAQKETHRIVNIIEERLLRGFQSKKLSVYGELDIYEFSEKKPEQEVITSLREIEDFKPGEFLVHKTHGIGRYVDTISRKVDGNKKDYFLIEYAKGDRLYVPTWQADRLTRYIGSENPTITQLHSKQWDSMKKRVRKSVKKLAIDLSRLYAQREAAQGYSFPGDSPWQREIADLFPFSETGDQAKAIEKVKQAMSRQKPMDMLLCGDVGFGKTEVAIRAAFGAIEAGKQVMMLVPTTILADQHFKTFARRYRDYPVVLEVLSRFKKKSSQRKIISRFNEGKVDMVIGTHRILQEDIKPPDLGLIIIDEEQRFGVASKEKIKLLKKNADVLTLTATPIPRTLYMALTGIRDIATIQTYPQGRNPIETFVGRKDESVIRQAVQREMARGGQVYYVYNNVRGIESKMHHLQSIVPQAKIAVTHGQLRGDKIEHTMSDFINKKYDILLTTTIIESGMDISNVNTLIVEDSHRFGLSQLYQLRGRVGRSTERAYSYFFYPDKKHLSITALRRLKALSEHTDLGSGYSIALRDMEIRGAGEILGPRQSGHMDSVGFDMYCQIIKEEVARIKGERIAPDINVQIEIPVSAYIPKAFIPREHERINAYRSLGKAREIEEAQHIEKNLVQRYGQLPKALKDLVNIAKIKILMQNASISSLTYQKGRLILKKAELESPEQEKLVNINPDVYYDRKTQEVILETGQDIDLDLMYTVLSVIMDFKFKKERGIKIEKN